MDLNNPANQELEKKLNVTAIPSLYLFLGNLDGVFVDVAPTSDKLVEFYQVVHHRIIRFKYVAIFNEFQRVSNVVVDKVESANELEKFKVLPNFCFHCKKKMFGSVLRTLLMQLFFSWLMRDLESKILSGGLLERITTFIQRTR